MITCYFEDNQKARGGLRHVTVNVIVLHENKVLLGKRGTAHGKKLAEWGKWGLLGGYFDRDETLIQAAQREVREESGCEISNLLLFRINDKPDRPKEDRQNVEIVFIADFVSQIPQVTDEVTKLEWFSLDNLPPAEEIAFDHGEVFSLYKEYLKKNHSLPLIG